MNESLMLLWTLAYLAGSFIMVLVNALFYHRHKFAYLPYWIGFWTLLTLAYVFGLMHMRFEWLFLMMLFSGAMLFSGLIFLKSIYLYVKMPMRITWLVVTIIIYLILMVSYFTPLDDADVAMWIYIFAGFFYIIAGFLLWRPTLYRQRFIGAIFVFFGLTVVFYPLLLYLSTIIYYSLFIINIGGIGFTMSTIFLHLYRIAHEDMFFKTKLYNMALYDVLTGLYNRRYLDNEVHYFKEDQHPIGVIMCDLDNLKEINDAFGHKTGDQLLMKTAQILKSEMPKNAIVARYGGDEFVALLFNASEAMIKTYLKRLNENFAITVVAKKPIKISLGYALKDKDQPFDEAFKEADQAMYQMKFEQKNT